MGTAKQTNTMPASEVSNRSNFMESILISLVREHKAEGKAVVIGAMVSFLMESFSFMSESQALVIATKAYANA